ncbi:MAG: biotin/lipoyl-binding protein, partial [Anaerolineae bacterium]
MLKGRRSRLIIVAIVLVAVVAGYFGIHATASTSSGALKASGTIEATTVNVSPELPGKVQEVLVEEGQAVQPGQVLFRLDGTLLSAQRDAAAAGLTVAQSAAQTAQAGYQSAQAQFTAAQTAARLQARSTRLSDWSGKTPSYFDQPKWYFTQDEQLAAAQAEVQAAQAGVTSAEQNLATVVADLKNADFVKAEERLSKARAGYLVALQVQAEGQAVGSGLSPDQLNLGIPGIAPFGYLAKVHVSQTLPNNAELDNAAQAAYDAANAKLTSAQ